MKSLLRFCPFLLTLLPLHLQAEPALADYIRPFVGTKGEGNTYPGPVAPFGMVQPGPDTADDLWENAAGYKYADTSIMGFSLTHLSGTGIPDLGDFLFIPQIGEPKLVPGAKEKPDAGYRARFSHDQEWAAAGYYKVKLLNNNVTVELTASERAGMMRLTFPESERASVLTDLRHFLNGNTDAPGRFKIIWSRLRVEDNSTVTGFHLVSGWARERYLYFAARYSRPFEHRRIYSNGQEVKYDSYVSYRFRSRNEAAGTNLQFLAEYKTRPDEVIQVKVAVSAVSAANALENLDREIPGWDFDRVRRGHAREMEPRTRPACGSKARRRRKRPSTPRSIIVAWRPAFMRMSMASIGDWIPTFTGRAASPITPSSPSGTPTVPPTRFSP